MRKIVLALVALAGLSGPAMADETLKIGFLTVQSGPAGVIGQEQRNGLDLAIKKLGGTVGGYAVEVISGDTKFNPGEAVQQANKMMDLDEVDVVTGLAGSHTMMAASKPLLGRGFLVLSANAGPSPLAGKGCDKNLFVVSFQNDQWSQGIGKYMTENGVKNGYFMGMDYQAGWDHTKAVIHNFGGAVVNEVFTPTTQLDFSAELSQLRAAKPDAAYAFYVGGAAIAFLKQYSQAGLQDEIPLYSMTAMSDPTLFKAQGDAALGLITGTHWNEQFDIPENKEFVANYREAYGHTPSTYAASQYDAVILLDAAIKQAGGFKDRDALRAALKAAPFKSVRGAFAFNTNQFPIQNIYMQQVEKDASGEMYQKLLGMAAADVKDPYFQDCSMN
jgi:branched-chain amino acid transport system substrate-binding protein